MAFAAADKGWELALELREKLADAEESVQEAVDKLTVAGHVHTVAKIKSAKAMQVLRWVRQEEKMSRETHAAQAAVKLRAHREQALLCRQLATIALDAPLDAAAPPFARTAAEAGTLHALCEALRFGPMTRRRLYTAVGLEFTPPALPA